MRLKEDWTETEKRYTAWWARESNVPLLQVFAPRQGIKHTPQPNAHFAFLRYQDDPQKAIDVTMRDFEQTWFGGEAFPSLWLNLGPGVQAAFYTDFLHFDPVQSTAWFEVNKEWDEIENLRFDPPKTWWDYAKRITELAARNAPNNFIVGQTDIGGPMDVTASLRGSESLLVDLLTEGERVVELRKRLLANWHFVYEDLDSVMQKVQHGRSAWMSLWCEETWYPIQCDFCAMIGPEMFEQHVLPDLHEQSRRLGRTIYHLDGPGAVQHLDAILDIQELDGIQWVPGAGTPACDDPKWLPMYEKILAKDKLLVLQQWDDVTRIAPTLHALSKPERALATLWLPSEEQGRAFIKECRGQ